MIGSIWCFWFCLFFLKRQVLPIFRAKLMTPIDVSRNATSLFRVGDYSWRQGMETKIKNIEWTQLFCPNIGSIWCFWFCPYVSSKFDAHRFCQWCPWNSFWYWSFGVGGETLTSESCSFFNLGVVPSGWVVKPWPRRVLFLLRCCSFRVGGETLTSESPFFTKVLFLQGGWWNPGFEDVFFLALFLQGGWWNPGLTEHLWLALFLQGGWWNPGLREFFAS